MTNTFTSSGLAPKGDLEAVDERPLLAPVPSRRLNARHEALRERAAKAVFAGTAWLSSADVGKRINPEAANIHALARRWLKEGKVFAVQRECQWEFPEYAFEGAGFPVPALAGILAVLEGLSPYSIAAWFESTSSALDGKRPRELLATDAKAVLAAAEALRMGPMHG